MVEAGNRWTTSKGWITIVDSLCKGCGFCIEFCPTHALEASTDFNAHGYHYPVVVQPASCVNCGYCHLLCPDFAIWSEREVFHP